MPSIETASTGPSNPTTRQLFVAAVTVIVAAVAILIPAIRLDWWAGCKEHPDSWLRYSTMIPDGKDDGQGSIPLLLEQLDGAPVVAIVGSGLAGMAAALESVEKGAAVRVIVLEKEAKVGGNSAKASSGINAVTREAGDSIEAFIKDTISSGGLEFCEHRLVETLAKGSEDGLRWLNSFGVDLNASVKLGGHGHARTRYPSSGRPVGATVIGRLKEAMEREPRIQVITQAKVTQLSYSSNTHSVNGLFFLSPLPKSEDGFGGTENHVKHREYFLPAASIVLASGGFAANTELMHQVAPEVAKLPTTNGPWAQGDGIFMAREIGAAITNLSLVQVHPTAFVNKAERESRSANAVNSTRDKILAPERMRGAGAVLLNDQGRRFVDELETRAVVTRAMLQLPNRTAWMVLPQHVAFQCGGDKVLGFYVAKGLMTVLPNVQEAAKFMNVPEDDLIKELAASPGFSSCTDDVPSPRNSIGVKDVGLYIARVSPAIHYTMGGIAIDEEARVLDRDGVAIPGLYAAGEVTGGVHGKNRLAGNSLLDCCVYGRMAGENAAAFAVAAFSDQK
jgi:FAD-dependent fumarate reductase